MRKFGEFRICKFDEVASTNDVVKHALAMGEAEGLVVLARRQTKGYGRQGRTWVSPEGGLYLSVLLRPQVTPDVLPTMSLAVGIAVRRALVSFVSSSIANTIKLKWPNDIVVVQALQNQQRTFYKLCGISLETFAEKGAGGRSGDDRNNKDASFRSGNERDGWDVLSDEDDGLRCNGNRSSDAERGGVCVGIGVNVIPSSVLPNTKDKNAPIFLTDLISRTDPIGRVSLNSTADCASLAERAARAEHAGPTNRVTRFEHVDLIDHVNHAGPTNHAGSASQMEKVSIEAVCDAVLSHLSSVYRSWQTNGLEPMLAEYNRHAALTGSRVRVENRSGNLVAQGTVQRIDNQGRLVLVDESGAEVYLCSGEAHLI